MAEEIVVEMAPLPPRKPFWRRWGMLLVMLFLALVILAAFFSWWLSRGKITSLAGRLDTMVYTVESRYSALVEEVLVATGDSVETGQVLARVDVTALNQANSRQAVSNMPSGELAMRLGAAQQAEKELAARAERARQEEERLRAAYQERVTEHVRAQLAMRSINPRNTGAYQQASQAEANAKALVEAARTAFEQGSRGRAAQDQELARIRLELARSGRGATAPANARASSANAGSDAFPGKNDLYAPVSGTILAIRAVRGQVARAGQPLFMVLPTGSKYAQDSWIQAWFPVDARSKIKVGQTVAVKFLNNSEVFNGKVAEIDNSSSSPDGNLRAMSDVSGDHIKDNAIMKFLPVKVVLDDPAQIAKIAPGSKVDCQIQTRYLVSPNLF